MKVHSYTTAEGAWRDGYDKDDVKQKLKEMVEDITWLLQYARRVSQGQVVTTDVPALDTIRQNLKETKEIIKYD